MEKLAIAETVQVRASFSSSVVGWSELNKAVVCTIDLYELVLTVPCAVVHNRQGYQLELWHSLGSPELTPLSTDCKCGALK